jgi:hypothetical protein
LMHSRPRHQANGLNDHTVSHKFRHVLAAAMSSRISIARPQANNYNSDPHGLSNSRSSASTGYRSANPDDPMEKLQAFSKQVEDYAAIYSQPLKPHLPAIGRFLIVVTFLEDALRILTQWSDQLWYLQQCVLACARAVSQLLTAPQTQKVPLGTLTSIPDRQRYRKFLSEYTFQHETY